jgi:predicted secreted protein with PEFG-CTERM motif
MRLALSALSLLAVMILIPNTLIFAETYEIKIASGASNSNAPYFWSEKSTGVTSGEITVYPGDSVTWNNADSALHTITSITVEGEEDGIFDSGVFTVGESYTGKFNDLGDFNYYCILHTWMTGVVHVVENPGSVQSIEKIASGFTDDGLGFEVKYISDTTLDSTVVVDSDEKTLTFTVSGDTKNGQISFVLPVDLIENPNTIWIDGSMVDFETEAMSTGTKLVIPIEPHSKEIKIMGSYVIPEFGFLAMSILSVGLISVLFLTRTKYSINFRI